MNHVQEALQAIDTAIQIERDGLAFYTEAARQIVEPKGRRMFQTLAQDEAAHLRLFEETRKSLLEGNDWLSPGRVATISPRKPIRQPVFPTGDEAKKAGAPERQLAALRRGIQAEEDSIEFYSEQMDKADDADGKAMYAYLIGQEEGHRTILQGEYDYLTNTGFWFDVRGFDLEAAG